MSSSCVAVPNLLEFGKQCIERALLECSKKIWCEQKNCSQVLAVLDATCGNGNDTLFLANTLRALQKKYAEPSNSSDSNSANASSTSGRNSGGASAHSSCASGSTFGSASNAPCASGSTFGSASNAPCASGSTFGSASNAPCASGRSDSVSANIPDGASVSASSGASGYTFEYTVLGFDIQPKALENTRFLLQKHGHTTRICLHALSHAEVGAFLVTPLVLSVAVYNLGYLPGNDKHITTQATSTLTSLEHVKHHLVQGGVISVHAYGGHEGGMVELEAVKAWFMALPYKHWRVGEYALCNKTLNPEVLFLAQKQ